MRARLFSIFLATTLLGILACSDSSKQEMPPLTMDNVAVETAEPGRIVVFWSTSQPTDGEVAYGTDSTKLDKKVPVGAVTTLHRTLLEGLQPGTTYYIQVKARAGAAEVTSSIVEGTVEAPAPLVAEGKQQGYDVAVIRTTYGEVVFKLLDGDAPKHTANFRKLAGRGFYDGTTFHRVIPNFMIQGGDPNSKDGDRTNDGTGGPGYTIPAEIKVRHLRGSVAAARQGDEVNPEKRSSGSQFYICVAPQIALDGKYTVFGEVVRGMDVVDKIVNVPRDGRDNPRTAIPMRSVTIRHVEAGETP
jgi:cyclophilin family peptidyl-prolyl cis-trans isomerase